MVVFSVDELLDALVSGSLAARFAIFAMLLAVVGLTMRVIVADVPPAKLGIRQVTVVPERAQLPKLELAETKVVPVGIVSVIRTPVAGGALLFVTFIV